jgi:predicted nucleotide-binding protein
MARALKKAVQARAPAAKNRTAATRSVTKPEGVKKVSVSLAADDLAWAHGEARARKLSLSAVLSDALHRRRRSEALETLLHKLGAAEIPEAELAKLRAELYGAR